MPISANTLFHFTRSRQNLIGILKNEFQPKYCLEDRGSLFLGTSEEVRETAMPMTCFCDLPLSSVSEHLRFYGRYGIGLSKEWGTKNGMNPVLYLCTDSTLANYLLELLAQVRKEDIDLSYTVSVLETFAFVKPYEGRMLRNGKYHNRQFYDEREWRYVPHMSHDDKYCRYMLDKDEFLNRTIRELENRALAKWYTLPFEPKDIRYIIVSKDSEILPMIEDIQKIKGAKYDWDTLRVLSSRIISAERIASDF